MTALLRLMLALALGLSGALSLRGQGATELDPSDVTTYMAWAQKEVSLRKKYEKHTLAERVGHETRNASEMPTQAYTMSPNDGSGSFWKTRVPNWVKRFGKNPFDYKKSEAGNEETVTQLFKGITKFANMRASLRTLALMKASIAGMRFEVNAWKMMKNIDVVQYEQVTERVINIEEPTTVSTNWRDWVTKDQSFLATKTFVTEHPLGVISFGIVPSGKEKWREAVEYLQDDPHYDGASRDRIRYVGPRKWGDLDLAAEEAWRGDAAMLDARTEMEQVLDSVDKTTRAVAQGIADIRSMVNKRVGQTVQELDSPRRLWDKTKMLEARRNRAYDSLVGLRALLEDRNPEDVAREYQGLLASYADDAAKAYSTAEASANFYQQIANQADNAVAPLDHAERLAELKKIEDLYAKWVDEMNKRELKPAVDEFLRFCGTIWPSLIPYVGAIKMPLDAIAVATGTAADASMDDDRSDDDEQAEVKAMMKETQAEVFGVRFGYYLWEELRVWRKLTYLLDQERVASKAVEKDPQEAEALAAACDSAITRQIMVTQLRIANDQLASWVGTTP